MNLFILEIPLSYQVIHGEQNDYGREHISQIGNFYRKQYLTNCPVSNTPHSDFNTRRTEHRNGLGYRNLCRKNVKTVPGL